MENQYKQSQRLFIENALNQIENPKSVLFISCEWTFKKRKLKDGLTASFKSVVPSQKQSPFLTSLNYLEDGEHKCVTYLHNGDFHYELSMSRGLFTQYIDNAMNEIVSLLPFYSKQLGTKLKRKHIIDLYVGVSTSDISFECMKENFIEVQSEDDWGSETGMIVEGKPLNSPFNPPLSIN